jgi:hypothetical protein
MDRGVTKELYSTHLLTELTNPITLDALGLWGDPNVAGNLFKLRVDMTGPSRVKGIHLALPPQNEGEVNG